MFEKRETAGAVLGRFFVGNSGNGLFFVDLRYQTSCPMSTLSNRVQEINDLVKRMSVKEQDALLAALKKRSILEKTSRLDSSVLENPLTMQDAVNEVREVRRERYGRQ